MTDVGLIQFGARSLDCAPVLAIARTGAALGMTGGVMAVDMAFLPKAAIRIVQFHVGRIPAYCMQGLAGPE